MKICDICKEDIKSDEVHIISNLLKDTYWHLNCIASRFDEKTRELILSNAENALKDNIDDSKALMFDI